MTTRSFWIISGLFALLSIAGLISANNILIALSSPLIVYILISVAFAPGEINLKARRSMNTDRITEGMEATINIQVENEGAKFEELSLYDLSSLNLNSLERKIITISQLNTRESIQHEYHLKGRRGNYRFDGLLALARDPFGIFETQDILPALGSVLVYPSISNLKAIPIQPPQTKGFSGPLLSRRSGTGMDFFDVRQYQFGDSLRRINWKTSAQHTENLYTNQFEQERVADVGLILDARPHCDLSFQGRSLFEYSVHAIASLSKMLLDEGHCLSMLIYGANVTRIFPGYGRVHYERVLKTLAQADTGINYVTEHLHYFPARLLPPRGQLIYISPLTNSDLEPMKRFRDLGYAVLIISPNPLFFERQIDIDPSQPDYQLAERFAQIERDLLINNLRQAGLLVANWNVDRPFSEVVDKVRIEFSQHQRNSKVLQ